MSFYLVNAMPARAREMEDAQRKAMFARMRSGGGGGGGGGKSKGSTSGGTTAPSPSSTNVRPAPANQSVLAAAVSGFMEGLRGGASIAANTLSFGLSDKLGITQSSQYQGPEYSFSRAAATVSRESLLAAAGIGVASKLGAAWKGTSLARTAAGKHAGAIATVAGFGSQSVIDDYRMANPTINPYTDKALAMGSQLAGYVGSMGALKAVGQYGGALLKALPGGGGLSALGRAKQGLKMVDDRLGQAGTWINGKLNPTIAAGLKKAHAGYTKFSDFTGSSLKELGKAISAPKNLKTAQRFIDDAARMRAQASAIKSAAAGKKIQLQNIATSALNDAHKASLAGSPDAGRLYRKAADAFWAVDDAARQSAGSAARLNAVADKLITKGTALRADTISGLKKAGYVAGGFTAKEAYDQKQISKYQQQAAQAIRDGKPFSYPVDDPRGIVGTLLAGVVGTTGNPLEKQTRYGTAAYHAQVGAYRAGYDAIMDAKARGELSPAKAQQALEKLAASKPQNMAGKGLWTFAPAAAAYLNWQIGDAIKTGKRSSVERTSHAYDGDTIFTDKNPTKGVRMLDINAPELKATPKKPPEYLGDVAAARIQELIKPGQYVRVVSDSNPKAGGLDKHGRKLGVVETLPKPFDNLLRIPYVGKVIPAVDVNKKLIKEGLVDIHYRDLSGRTDKSDAYDAARAVAQARGTGIWSPEGRAALPWVGTEKTTDQRRADAFKRSTGRDLPEERIGPVSQALGLGLMTTGNSGIFGAMPRSGTALAQTYNAVLAALGTVQYNEQARRASKRRAKRPTGIKTDYDRRVEEAMSAIRN
ncbi:MAG TPA: thermonuclease family protein [Kiritimatiellia bacterium]|nr:thermonuclease family protein [Kiritimatiellia bacterium]HMP35013.1 thermonuclease family protein [Kiritimatiellia bacterium]